MLLAEGEKGFHYESGRVTSPGLKRNFLSFNLVLVYDKFSKQWETDHTVTPVTLG
jgi:hypothetical protein